MQLHRLATILTCVTCWLVCVAAAPQDAVPAPARPASVQRAVGDAPAVALAMHRAFPNPSRGDVTLGFTLDAEGPATLELVDIAGRSVLRRDPGGLGAGRHELRLGTDSARLSPGMYFARLTQRERSVTSRVVVLSTQRLVRGDPGPHAVPSSGVRGRCGACQGLMPTAVAARSRSSRSAESPGRSASALSA